MQKYEILYYHKVQKQEDKPKVTHLTVVTVYAITEQEAKNLARVEQPEETYLVKVFEVNK